MEMVFIWIIAAILGAIIGAIIGAPKGKAFLGFILGLLLSFIGVIIILLIPSSRQCPYCKSNLHKDASVCAKCGKDLVGNNS